ncbi:helix-turn-helix transcriptional regulator [Micromonospora sp. bgisy143]|uniref:helix-turn-helix transcriptional regulator n=1 Tax=Micromonospora sp. bgisy143 TaxID=3413790 RepID=UPI003EBC625A
MTGKLTRVKESGQLFTVRHMDLVGAAEIRAMLGGISKQRVYVITSHRNFPEPVADLVQGKVWRKSDVRAWIREHRPELAED